MAKFQTVTLSDVTTLVTKGTTPTTLGYAFTDSGVNFIKAESVTLDGQIDESVFAHIDEEAHKKLKRSQIEEGDILFSIAGMKLGKSAVVKSRHVPANTNQAVAIIRADRSKALPEFLHYHFLNPDHYRYVNAITAQAAQPNINLGQVGGLPISLPPLPVQRRIAGILSAYDELIENSQRRIRILESMARALYREWFVQFRYPGHEKFPRVASPLGEIPRGWEVKKLGDIAEDMRRNVPKGELEEPTPYVGLEHIPRRSLALDAWETANELGSNKLVFKKGEVLFGKIRPYFHKVSVAPFDGLCSADTIVIRARRPEYYAIVVACVSSDAFVAEASATANGAKMPRANWDVLEKYKVVIPSEMVSAKFSALFVDILAQQQALIFQIQDLRRTRDLLLPRLLSGQVELGAA